MHALLINPYIYDFAAYNFWSSPIGLLYIGSVLKINGFDVTLIDCLDVVDEKRKSDGRAPFLKKRADKPEAIKDIKKHFKRYGISHDEFIKRLCSVEKPDIVLITTIMTYWYVSTKEVLDITREIFPSSKILLGGIYPSLCYEHANASMINSDLVIKNTEIDKFYSFLEDTLNIKLSFKPSMYDFESLPFPCFDLYDKIDFVPLITSYGCVYRCKFCATQYMHPQIIRRSADNVIKEICHWQERGVDKFVIYDDNFLYKAKDYAEPILSEISKLPFKINLYNPNALNASLVDHNTANLLYSSGFKEIRLGLETIEPSMQKSLCGKINAEDFENTINLLLDVGFSNTSISAYIIAGLPFQRWEDVKHSIDYLAGLGIKSSIAEYTPIPHTPLFDEFYSFARYPIEKDPIFQNNAIFPFSWDGFTDYDLAFLKLYSREKNAMLK
ncbi:MAG TPA: radical SAM protein [Syntrophorhabdaceae bacterium]|jgi:radical SAM superfamily enzyme YgiQ (UPF0313 family)|nr:radical SAM protein [Syntrophorhabdaceae bacterium]